jgi:hypothetical protein
VLLRWKTTEIRIAPRAAVTAPGAVPTVPTVETQMIPRAPMKVAAHAARLPHRRGRGVLVDRAVSDRRWCTVPVKEGA